MRISTAMAAGDYLIRLSARQMSNFMRNNILLYPDCVRFPTAAWLGSPPFHASPLSSRCSLNSHTGLRLLLIFGQTASDQRWAVTKMFY